MTIKEFRHRLDNAIEAFKAPPAPAERKAPVETREVRDTANTALNDSVREKQATRAAALRDPGVPQERENGHNRTRNLAQLREPGRAMEV